MLCGKNAIVTGARSGIGLAILKKLASEGVNVWAVVHREDRLFINHISSLAGKFNVWIHPVYIDLINEEAILQGLKNIIQEKRSVDILINAAGIVSPNRLIQMTPIEEMRKVMNVNFFAVVQLCQLTSRAMCRQRSGSIINIASIAGVNGDLAQLEYVASKAALIGATKKMAFEWADYNIRVNAIAPGIIDTKMQDSMDEHLSNERLRFNTIYRKGTAEEVAELCAFLADEKSSYITAQTITIDGGGANFTSTINRNLRI